MVHELGKVEDGLKDVEWHVSHNNNDSDLTRSIVVVVAAAAIVVAISGRSVADGTRQRVDDVVLVWHSQKPPHTSEGDVVQLSLKLFVNFSELVAPLKYEVRGFFQ